ncbi:MAG: PPOX class F420-dependent oxidoreductase [Anaerolineales bacterium]|nr:MAG: PPOX class F420-dependent oxidoreductase [Anaerolineales bacterium]
MDIPKDFKDLFTDETRALAFLATTMADGSPQVTPVWFDTEGEWIRVNTARGRVKDRNMTARPEVALAIMDMQEPYRYIQIRGIALESTETGAREHIDRLAHKYLGTDSYESYKGETRVLYRIQVTSAQTME